MNSTTTLRSDHARTGTNPDFPINSNPWHKYVSVDFGTITIGGTTSTKAVRAGVLVVESWLFNAGPQAGQSHTLVLVAMATNEIYCFSEGDLLVNGSAAAPLWHTSLGVAPMMRVGSNIPLPIGVCGTPVVDTANRRMFVVAMWDDGSGTGNYSIFNLGLDTGNITTSQRLVDKGASGRATFNPDLLDQRTAINLVRGWLWFGFADYYAYDAGPYYGWVVAVKADDLNQQLYQPMVSLNSTTTWGVYAGGVWGPGGVASAADGAVYALTGNATIQNANYWQDIPAAGPGSLGDYFNGIVRLDITESGSTAQLRVLDWFQSSSFTESENAADFDFGGSSPVVLPPINGRQLVAFVPKDGNVFVLDSQNLGHYSNPLTLVKFADVFNQGGNDTKVAIAFFQTRDGRNILIIGADSTGSRGGFAAFQLDAAVTPPTLTKLWQAPTQLRDSFGSPTVIANPVPDPSRLPNPLGLTWVIDGDDAGNGYLDHCALRAYDVLTGNVAYDSTVHNDVTEQIPHFTPITSGGKSIFCTTSKGFMGFTQSIRGPARVHQLYYNNNGWIDQDLTAFSQGPLAESASDLSSFAIADGQHVYYLATDQHVHQLYYNNHNWIDQDLTAFTHGPLAERASGVSSFAIADGQHVYYLATDQHVHQLYYNNHGWIDQDLTAFTHGPLAESASDLSSFAIADGQHVYYLATDQHVHQLYYSNHWIDQDLTAFTGGPLAERARGLSTFAIADGQHVYYLATDQHVHQLYYNNNSWIDQDLTAFTHGPLADSASDLSSFAIADGQHVYYLATDQHVHQLYYNNNSWIDQDLTAFTGGPLAERASGVSSFAIADGQHVYYLATDRHVHQLYYNNHSWIDQDLTTFTNGPMAEFASDLSSFAIADGQHLYYLTF